MHIEDSNTQDLTNTGLAFAAEDKKDMALFDALSKQAAKHEQFCKTLPTQDPAIFFDATAHAMTTGLGKRGSQAKRLFGVPAAKALPFV